MAMDFPASPTLNQVFGSYQWDGEKWVTISSTQTVNGTGQLVGTTNALGVVLQNNLGVTSTTGSTTTTLVKPAGSFGNNIRSRVGSLTRWLLALGDNATESGSETGTDFTLTRYFDDGSVNDNPFAISRKTGQATFLQPISAPGLGYRNRIINGNFSVDQWNSFATITPINGQFVSDRWRTGVTQAGKISTFGATDTIVSTASTGCLRQLIMTTVAAFTPGSSDYFWIVQPIEGFNFNDLLWGTSYAKDVTVSFWATSSITGTHSGSIRNAAGTRSYPFTFVVGSAGVKSRYTVTIPGDMSGVWSVANNLAAAYVFFNLGCGTAMSAPGNAWAAGAFYAATGAIQVVATLNATLSVTGVQLEAGDAASAFELRPLETELRMCQRYYVNGLAAFAAGYSGASGNTVGVSVSYPVTMRATATFVLGAAGNAGAIPATNVIGALSTNSCNVSCTSNAAGGYIVVQNSFSANAEI
jgi:hypothetical protein